MCVCCELHSPREIVRESHEIDAHMITRVPEYPDTSTTRVCMWEDGNLCGAARSSSGRFKTKRTRRARVYETRVLQKNHKHTKCCTFACVCLRENAYDRSKFLHIKFHRKYGVSLFLEIGPASKDFGDRDLPKERSHEREQRPLLFPATSSLLFPATSLRCSSPPSHLFPCSALRPSSPSPGRLRPSVR